MDKDTGLIDFINASENLSLIKFYGALCYVRNLAKRFRMILRSPHCTLCMHTEKCMTTTDIIYEALIVEVYQIHFVKKNEIAHLEGA